MTIQQQVESILRHVPASRDSDKELIVIYMQKCGMDLSPHQIQVFKGMPSVETIRRTRQLIQEQGKYPASPKVEAERFEKFRQMRQGGNPQEVIEQQEIKDTIRQIGWWT